MMTSRAFLHRLITVLMIIVPWLDPVASAEDQEAKKDGGKIAGILIDKNDNWITVKADGDKEPVKYVVDSSDKKLMEAFKTVFNACRVQLT